MFSNRMLRQSVFRNRQQLRPNHARIRVVIPAIRFSNLNQKDSLAAFRKDISSTSQHQWSTQKVKIRQLISASGRP